MDINWHVVLIIVVIIVLIIIILSSTSNHKNYEPFYRGIWTGSEAFCKDSEIDEMVLFIGNKIDKDSTLYDLSEQHGGYLIIRAEGYPVENKYVILDITPKLSYGNDREFTISIRDPPSDNSNELPSIDVMEPNMTMKLNIVDNTMSLYKDDQIYADMIKNNEATLLLKQDFKS